MELTPRTIVPCHLVEAAIAEDTARLAAVGSDLWLRYAALRDLATSLYSRFRCVGGREDLVRALEHLAEALRILPPAHAAAENTRLNIGTLEEELAAWDLSAQPPTNDASALADQAATAFQAFQARGELAELDSGIRHLEEAMRLTPKGDADRIVYASNLATMLLQRYTHGPAEDADLDRGIELYESIAQDGDGHRVPGFAESMRVNLPNAYLARYMRSQDPEDVAKARQLQGETGAAGAAAEATMSDTRALVVLADFYRTGNLRALDLMIREQERAIDEAGVDDSRRAVLLLNASRCYLAKAQALDGVRPEGSMEAINRGIAMAELAVAARSTPVYAAAIQVTVGIALFHRYGMNPIEHRADLDRSISVLGASTPMPALDQANRLVGQQSLASALTLRAERDRRPVDLDEAARILSSMRGFVRPTSLIQCSLTISLSQLAQVRSAMTGDPADVRAAAREGRQAYHSLRKLQPSSAFRVARVWGDAAWDRGTLDEAAEAYGYALEALHGLSAEQVGRADQQDMLRAAGNIAGRAAFAAAGRSPEAAAVALESGRALMLSEALERANSQLAGLVTSGHPDLHRRYQAAVATVAECERRHLGVVRSNVGAIADDDLGDLAAARDTLSRLVDEVRQVPGFRWFLQPPTAGRLREVARACTEPVVCLVSTERGGTALIYPPGGREPVSAVPLPRLVDSDLAQVIEVFLRATEQTDEVSMDTVVRWMWDAVMEPVVSALAASGEPTGAVLVPAGRLGMLPLHAAARPDPQQRTGWRFALDDLALRYSPTIRALADAPAWPAAEDVTLLAVADPLPTPDGLPPLPMAAFEAELVRCQFTAGRSALLAGTAASRSAVRAALGTSDVYHFACHAEVDLTSPLDSGLGTSRGRLTVRDLLGTPLGRGRLAVLSACETARFDTTVPEEVVGLPTAFLQAGVPGVIASLWRVSDSSTVALMARFYELWRQDGLSPPDALRKAQQWLRDSTNEEVRRRFPFAVEVPKASYSGWSRRRGHSGVLQWAGFAYVGT